MNRAVDGGGSRPKRLNRRRTAWVSVCALLAAGGLLGADLLAEIREDVVAVHGAWRHIALVYYASWSVVAGLAILVLVAAQRQRRGCGDAGGGRCAGTDGGGGQQRVDADGPVHTVRTVVPPALEDDLRAAIAQDQFVLYFQPIVDAAGRQRGVEALLRWTHPRRGIVPPDEFIAVAEQSGLIGAIGQWVLEQACRQLARFSAQASTAHWTVAVNVSAAQFQEPDFLHLVVSTLRRTGAPPERLKLELTESMLLLDVEGAGRKMQALRARGVTCALDDFGTGYASLSYLRTLPLSALKIDRSFVRDAACNANDAAIVRMLVALACSLGLDVVAEGVETPAQFAFLKSTGCTFFQGYLFGQPAPSRQASSCGGVSAVIDQHSGAPM